MSRYSLRPRVLVTGGAGVIGSFLCRRLLDAGAQVLCVDNFFTGTRDNVSELFSNPDFELLRHRWLDHLLHTRDTPERTALAYAVGVFFGFSPLLGLHTVLGLIVAFLFNLNRVAVLLGIYSNLPWILPAYYTLATDR